MDLGGLRWAEVGCGGLRSTVCAYSKKYPTADAARFANMWREKAKKRTSPKASPCMLQRCVGISNPLLWHYESNTYACTVPINCADAAQRWRLAINYRHRPGGCGRNEGGTGGVRVPSFVRYALTNFFDKFERAPKKTLAHRSKP